VKFKKKAAILSALIFILALVYILSFVFDPQRQTGKAFAWLEREFLDLADRIEIYESGNAGNKIVLYRKNNFWVVPSAAMDYPAKQGRVEDLLAALSQKGIYLHRAASTQARERLGLGEGIASRIVVRGGAGLPLLDLLIGTGDALGQGVYLRRAGKNEIYSGEDNFTFYTGSDVGFWFDLRLFPADTVPLRGSNQGRLTNTLTVDSVQQADVTLPGNDALPFILRRSGSGWIIPGNENAVIDSTRVEGWLRSVLEAEGDNFTDEVPESVEGSITLWFGNGTRSAIQIGLQDEDKRRSAVVSESEFVYVLSEWIINRLFRDSLYFLKTN